MLRPDAQTVGLIPTVHVSFGPQVDDDSVGLFTVLVFAQDHNLGQAYWEYRIMLKRVLGADLIGISSLQSHSNSASAVTWTATVAFVNGDIDATLTGAIALNVDWLVTSAADPVGMVGVF